MSLGGEKDVADGPSIYSLFRTEYKQPLPERKFVMWLMIVTAPQERHYSPEIL